jgi:hypothetical protein
MSRWCSNQLSYAPENLSEPTSIAPACASTPPGVTHARHIGHDLPSTLASRPESATSTVKVIQAVPLTDWVCTPVTFIFSLANTSDVAQQALAVGGLHRHVHRVGGRCRRALPQATSITRSGCAPPSRGSCCSRAVHADALAAGDEAADGVGRRRLAAAASCVISESTPTTSTPPLGVFSAARDFR